MVTPGRLLLALVLAAPLAAQTPGAGPSASGPVLWGDGGGRVWKWEAGVKTPLTPEGLPARLGAVGETQLWGWSVENGQARTFTLELPKKQNKAAATPDRPAAPVFDPGRFPVPDRIDRLGDRQLLVYGALSGHPRVEVTQAGLPFGALAWDDGRVVYAAGLGPGGQWAAAGRTADGQPWLTLSGREVPAPEGWRGRLTVVAWVSAEKDGPVEFRAAGWGAPGDGVPRALFWGPLGWTQPDPEGVDASEGTYPLLGAAGEKGLTLAGWRADAGTGVLRPWFWDGEAESVPGGAADGQPQALGTGKGGSFLVVRHQSAPWFTQEDGKESVALEGLDADDRVVTAGTAEQ